jgi:two-component system, LytTR family, response regulator
MLRAIIIDDEQAGIDLLKVLAERNAGSVRIVASTTDASLGRVLIEDFHPDVVFLDISMPAMSGFELLETLAYRDFRLIFTTAHREYAIEAIKKRAFDYLLKPIDHADFAQCIRQLVEAQAPAVGTMKHPQIIELQEKDGINYIRLEEIIRLEASRSYTIFHLEGKVRHVVSRPLKEFEEKLRGNAFYRCHNSHIVNLNKVQKFVNHQGYYALMNDGSMADIAKKCKEPFLELLKGL